MAVLTFESNLRSAYQVPLNYASLPVFDDHNHGYSSGVSGRTEGPQVIQAEDRTMQSPQSKNAGSPESPGRKRALCIGIDYRRESIELEGCVKDAKNISDFLKKHGYQDITMLTDETDDKPTKKNILKFLTLLVDGALTNDSLFLHYSGHGSQVIDKNGDESDGEDEGINCLDSPGTDSQITDDDIHEILQRLPSGCRLTALFDSCHSGTILDLPYAYNCLGQRFGKVSNLRISADVVCWSGAKDSQLGADTSCGGAMTCAFIKSLNENPIQSYKQLLHSLRTIVNCQKGNQTPQLGSSQQINPSLTFIF